MLKTISRLQATYVALFKELAPQISDEFKKIHVEIGKLGDPNAKIQVPAIYVTRGNATVQYLSIRNLKNFSVQPFKYSHVALLTLPIIIEVVAGNYGSCEILTDTCMRIILVSKRFVEKEFQIHFIGNPVVSPPEIAEQGMKEWKSIIQFEVQKEIQWEEGKTGPLIEQIIFRVNPKQNSP
ncbi:MAG: hypothetical protein DSY42_09390 [Aquifex sp.]|nr:MAG: hypothetical protein DSY42_09390 [Aquifex sp.]